MACLAHAEGELKRACADASVSLRLSAEVRQLERAAGALRALAAVAAVAGQPGRAGRLIGAAERFQEPAGELRSLVERRLLERATADAVAALGEAAFAAAQAAGRALSLEQAVECGLS